MTVEELRAKVRDWDFRNNSGTAVADSKFAYILEQLDHHSNREWQCYAPTEHAEENPNYMERLARWIGNVTLEDDQKLLLEYALYINFFSQDDFLALYRTALDREVMRWVAKQVGANLNAGHETFRQLVEAEVYHHTWYCPITDSMDINRFYKVNNIAGVTHRPAFAPQQMLAEHPDNPNVQLANDWTRYMKDPDGRPELKRLVLLEDMVGSGSQCLDAVRWATVGLDKPVLFIPLILCPNGVDALRREEGLHNGRLTVRPIIQLARGDLLGPERGNNVGWPITSKMEDFARRCASGPLVGLNAFGFRSTGCSVVMFSNTPDNTLPIVHHRRNVTWEPLFPRVVRG